MRTIAFLALLGVAGAADTAPGARTPPAQIGSLYTCRGEADPTRRLACYDDAVAALSASIVKQDVVVIDKAQIQSTRRSLFGLSLPRLGILDAAGPAQDEHQIVDTITAARPDPDGNWTITLRDGAIWTQIDEQTIARAPRPGDTATIVRGSLGSYFMRIGRQPGVRVMRRS